MRLVSVEVSCSLGLRIERCGSSSGWGCFVALLDNARHFMLRNVRLVSAFVPGTPFRMFLVRFHLGLRD